MSAHEVYLDHFYDNPRGIEEYKINFLKNHYFDIVSTRLMIDREDLLIGVRKNRTLIYFKSRHPKSTPIILDRKTNKFVDL